MPIWIMALIILSYIVVLLMGLVTGVYVYECGYKQGWKASYQVREDPDKGLFQNNDEPKEFAVLDEQEQEEEKRK